MCSCATYVHVRYNHIKKKYSSQKKKTAVIARDPLTYWCSSSAPSVQVSRCCHWRTAEDLSHLPRDGTEHRHIQLSRPGLDDSVGSSFHRSLCITAATLCSCCQHLQTARRKTCWSSSATFPSATKVSLSLERTEGRKEASHLGSVFWWQRLCSKATRTTSLCCCGWWTPSPSLHPFASWDRRPTWSSERASTWTLEGDSSCQGYTTGTM